MNALSAQDYPQLQRLIDVAVSQFPSLPSLERVADELHLPSVELEHLLKRWCGKGFSDIIPFLHPNYPKHFLQTRQEHTLSFEPKAIPKVHQSYIHIEPMDEHPPKAYQTEIVYHFYPSPFGELLIANTSGGVCYMAFSDDKQSARDGLHSYFPDTIFHNQPSELHQKALLFFTPQAVEFPHLTLHLKGTPFQQDVWKALLNIPLATLTTYTDIAAALGHSSQASRAVGTAIGSNPIAFVVPCHRVVTSSGAMGGYMWGIARKRAILAWEAVICDGVYLG